MAATKQSSMDRDELLAKFLTVLNICEPPHPYRRDPYPAGTIDVDYGYCQSSGRYWARCGPRRSQHVCTYSVDQGYMNHVSPERHLAILTHEVTHITEGSHTDGGSHNPAFWREMMFNAWQVREAWDEIKAEFGEVDEADYCLECIDDPNESMVDGRTETVAERRIENAELLGFHDYAADIEDES